LRAGRPAGTRLFGWSATLFLAAVVFAPSGVHAERWLCPCGDAVVERAPDSPELDCPQCGGTYSSEELTFDVAYINHRTRDAEVPWVVLPDSCGIFRPDGMQAFETDGDEIWVPWIMVDWFIPRMELVRLKDGREFTTDYPKGPTCVKPPSFLFELADTLNVPGLPQTISRYNVDIDLAELFIVASTPAGRDSAKKRFIAEVEAGKHPRLPRTPAKVRSARPAVYPPSLKSKNLPAAEVTLEVKVSDRGQLLRIRKVKSSGVDKFDQAALLAARTSSYQCGGEMGVPVPSSVLMHYFFEGGETRVEHEPAVPGVWN
jgi:TonB family protein